MHERAGELQALLHAAGEALDHLVGPLGELKAIQQEIGLRVSGFP